MIQTVFAWVLLLLILAAAYPWPAWLLARRPHHNSFWLPILLTLALSIGALTLLMFWQALFGLHFNLWLITIPYFVLALMGWWLWNQRPWRISIPALPASWPERLALLAFLFISAAVIFNAVYWPFYRDDTLGIYARYAKLMYETGTLVPFAGRDDAFYQAYPIQIPLLYTYTYLASGWVNEYLAKLMPALFSLGCLPAVYILGQEIFNQRAAWISALLLALMPTFVRWGSSGYVDLPMAFFYTLSAIFAWRLWRHGHWVDALLAGLLMGLAAWTKNAALLGSTFLFAWLGYGWLRRRIPFRWAVLALIVFGLAVAPWYLRNWLEARLIVPPTAWVDQTQPTLANLLIFITLPDNFSLPGWIILGGVLNAVWYIIRRRQETTGQFFLLLWTLPFFLVWWLLVSYDPRFLLLFLPLLAVLGGGWCSDLWSKIPTTTQNRVKLPLTALLLVLIVYNVWIAVDYKPAILRAPFMSDDAKHEIVLSQK